MSQLYYRPYEDCRVCAQNSHSGRSSPGARERGRSSLATIFKFFLFHILAHSFALFCASEKLNSFIFKRFRTLLKKTGAWERDKLQAENGTSFCRYILTSLRLYFLFPVETASARWAEYRRWLRVPGTAAGAAPAPSPSIPSGC